MEAHEVIALAAKTLNTLTDDINELFYAKAGGELTLRWGMIQTPNAEAESLGSPKDPPKHRITINEYLVPTLYNEIENYYYFLKRNPFMDILSDYEGENIFYKLTSGVKDIALIKNSFITALVWIFYHELAHLVQEHPHISPKKNKKFTELYERSELNSNDALTCHILELMADHFSTHFVFFDIVNQYRNSKFSNKEFDICLATSLIGISTATYLFADLNFENIDLDLKDSHPPAIIRLELALPLFLKNFKEIEELNAFYQKGKVLNSEKLNKLSMWIIASTFFFNHEKWCLSEKKFFFDDQSINKNLIFKSILERKNGKDYLLKINRELLHILVSICPILRFDLDIFLMDLSYYFKFTQVPLHELKGNEIILSPSDLSQAIKY